MEMMSKPNCRFAIIYIALAIVMMSMAQKIDAATSCKQFRLQDASKPVCKST
jgi:hypothetical protein